ncbi:NAD(P)H nitroreductase [Pseudomonas sp. CCC3.1]|uniref:NAD(P)H nitroreductase n=1 Tax=Pseudomonas sp. CCC3.1 TaxID=3048607 RepID=UPI002AC8CAD0|nr:NAD(P)H nitroreductase [Pseudomonas sp. CCC3.1]MEB0206505.1 NAD(P)H nitroreductase [Pseudomonas sp. CCC3.1]WPX38121.1 NAD(P)H nitroreductase [Pseudomonas sp. CCC3.1]
MEALDALLNRVSAPRLLDPAPSAEQREVLFAAALRAPDHGQLRPYRFLTVEGEARNQLGEILAEAVQAQGGEVTQAALDKARAMPLRAPLVVVVVARLQDHFKVPKSEQLITAGCAAHAIELAAYAQGIGAVWRTGELSYNTHVAEGLGLTNGEEVVAFLYLGTPQNELRAAPKVSSAEFVKAWSV